MNETTFYIFNEEGIIAAHQLETFSKKFSEMTAFEFKQSEKDDIDPRSTVYKKYTAKTLEYTIYDHGYVMKVEGDIRQTILLLMEIDSILSSGIVFFISPSQRIENSSENKFPRGATQKKIAEFLDARFHNKEYTSALASS